MILLQSCNPLFTPTEETPPGPRLESIAITRPPAKTEYEWGEALSLDGIEITGSYVDGSTQIIQAAGNAEISGYNPYAEGEQEVHVTVQGKTASFPVSVRISIVAAIPPMTTGSEWVLRAPQPGDWEIIVFDQDGGTLDNIELVIGADGKMCTITLPAEPGKYQIKASVTINGTVYQRLYTVELER